jgi:hypothetical protein
VGDLAGILGPETSPQPLLTVVSVILVNLGVASFFHGQFFFPEGRGLCCLAHPLVPCRPRVPLGRLG